MYSVLHLLSISKTDGDETGNGKLNWAENQDEYNLFMDTDIFDDDALFADVKDDELWP